MEFCSQIVLAGLHYPHSHCPLYTFISSSSSIMLSITDTQHTYDMTRTHTFKYRHMYWHTSLNSVIIIWEINGAICLSIQHVMILFCAMVLSLLSLILILYYIALFWPTIAISRLLLPEVHVRQIVHWSCEKNTMKSILFFRDEYIYFHIFSVSAWLHSIFLSVRL